MSLRIRKDGTVLCAAMHPEMEGDTYIPDNISYELTTRIRILVTEPMNLPPGKGRGGHSVHGQWWWANDVPDDVVLDDW